LNETESYLTYLHIVDLEGGSINLPCEFTWTMKEEEIKAQRIILNIFRVSQLSFDN